MHAFQFINSWIHFFTLLLLMRLYVHEQFMRLWLISINWLWYHSSGMRHAGSHAPMRNKVQDAAKLKKSAFNDSSLHTEV